MYSSCLTSMFLDCRTKLENPERTRTIMLMLMLCFSRLSPQLSQEVLLDEVSDAVLVDMMWETQMYLFEKRESLQTLAKLLLSG